MHHQAQAGDPRRKIPSKSCSSQGRHLLRDLQRQGGGEAAFGRGGVCGRAAGDCAKARCPGIDGGGIAGYGTSRGGKRSCPAEGSNRRRWSDNGRRARSATDWGVVCETLRGGPSRAPPTRRPSFHRNPGASAHGGAGNKASSRGCSGTGSGRGKGGVFVSFVFFVFFVFLVSALHETRPCSWRISGERRWESWHSQRSQSSAWQRPRGSAGPPDRTSGSPVR